MSFSSKRGTVILSHNLFYQWLLDFLGQEPGLGVTLHQVNIFWSQWPNLLLLLLVAAFSAFPTFRGTFLAWNSCSKDAAHCSGSQAHVFQLKCIRLLQFSFQAHHLTSGFHFLLMYLCFLALLRYNSHAVQFTQFIAFSLFTKANHHHKPF